MKFSVSIEDTLKKLCNLEIENLNPRSSRTDMEPMTHCLQSLLAVQLSLNSGTETPTFVGQLLMVQRLKNYTNARLYCELIRASLMSLHSVVGLLNESHWGAFIFLKVPLIIKELHTNSLNNSEEKFKYSQDVLDAFELLLHFSPLLDKIDATYLCNTVECLLNKLQKLNLVTEEQNKQLSSRR